MMIIIIEWYPYIKSMTILTDPLSKDFEADVVSISPLSEHQHFALINGLHLKHQLGKFIMVVI